MSFFVPAGRSSSNTQQTSRKRGRKNEEIDSDSDEDDVQSGGEESDNSIEGESAQEKRLRLAKEYLGQLEEQQRGKTDDKTVDSEALAQTIDEEYKQTSGKLRRKLASKCTVSCPPDDFVRLRGHKFPLTCVAVAPDSKTVVAAAKDGVLIKWALNPERRVKVLRPNTKTTPNSPSHKGMIRCVAISSDQKYMATGGEDTLIKIWNYETMEKVYDFTGHKAPVTGLCFRHGHAQLYSCSKDRSIKAWNTEILAYMDTLFGHQDSISSIDCLRRENCVTSGGNDHSIRLWKIADEKHLVFNTHATSGTVDCVRMIDEEHYISGCSDGSLCLWSTAKKKALCIVPKSHGEILYEAYWICSVAALPFSDLVASGSRDGFVRLWRVAEDYKSLEFLHKIAVDGFVSDMRFTESALVCALGKEHKNGRWWHVQDAKNHVIVIPLAFEQENDQS